MGVAINQSRYTIALRRYANWRKCRAVWLFFGFLIAGLFLAVLIFGIVDRPRPGEPLITAIEPPTGAPGEIVTALGRDIGTSRLGRNISCQRGYALESPDRVAITRRNSVQDPR
jgi:hypothetical protein